MTTITVRNLKTAPRTVRSISNLIRHDVLRVGYREWAPEDNDLFKGFVIDGESYRYADMRELKFARPKVDMDKVNAVFVAEEGAGNEWHAYRYKGRWAVGSSADTAKLYAPLARGEG